MTPPCFTPQPGVYYLDSDAIFVANTGSANISAFRNPGPGVPAGAVCGSPFPMSAPPTALGGGEPAGEEVWLVVLSAPQKTISLFKVDYIASVLTGPVATIPTLYTPMAVAVWENYYYIANAEGSVSAYRISGQAAAPTVAQVPGSPFPAGSGPAALAVFGPALYVANSQSNDISGYSLDPATGVPTVLPSSPFPAGSNPSSITVESLNPAFGGATVVMVTNLGSNDVSVFSMAGDGSLTPVPGSPFAAGTAPSAIAPDYGLYPVPFVFVANSKSNDISVYRVDDTTGALTPAPGSPYAVGSRPSSLAAGGIEYAVVSGALFVYVSNAGSNDMSVFSMNLGTAAMTPVPGSPFRVGQSPRAVLYFQVPQ
jgi:hypothetical protein